MAGAFAYCAAEKIVRSAVGLLLNKLYDDVTNQLKGGDVAKNSLLKIIVRDLNDIKLDCLSLKDLDASYSFLKEGVRLLNLAIDSASKDENESPPGEASRILMGSASDIPNEATSHRRAIEGLSISSKKRFLLAEGRFRASREEATRAFNNKSLSTENRIMACKLRAAATILESGLEDSESAITACLESLEELHGLPGIQDIFSVFLRQGFGSRYETKEQLENIKSVLSINRAIFDFASMHSMEYPNVFTWPGIELEDRKVNPILHANEIFEIAFGGKGSNDDVAVNFRCEIVLYCRRIEVIKSAGEGQDVALHGMKQTVRCMGNTVAVDSNGNIYVVRFFLPHDVVEARTVQQRLLFKHIKGDLVLYVFAKDYKLKHQTTLGFLHASMEQSVNIAVDKKGNIILIKEGDSHVYISNSKGQLKLKFERYSSVAYGLCTAGDKEIMIPSDDQRSVHVYTTEGILKSTIKRPQGHEMRRVALHLGICKVTVLFLKLTTVRERLSSVIDLLLLTPFMNNTWLLPRYELSFNLSRLIRIGEITPGLSQQENERVK